MTTVRTRFAPSPTGNVHIGNIRTAIYNWLHARHTGGQFLLRIEDTDQERSTPEAVQNVLDAMQWLGLDFDEEPVFQSKTRARHLEVAEELLSKGLAYKSDFGEPERGECIVFKMPGSAMSFDDQVKGRLTKQGEDMKDLIIVRSDGSPVFHLANVVDDIDMNVTWVVRGDDHVENTFRHVALYAAIGADLPTYAHLPMIVNAQGKPYSKRDGDAFVGDFKENGYDPEALFNYLVLLGWNPGDDREVLDRDTLVKEFDLTKAQSSAAQMDFKKLDWMNGEYVHAMSPADFKAAALVELEGAGIEDNAYLDGIFGLLQPRVKKLNELKDAEYFFSEDFCFDEKAVSKRLVKDGNQERLEQLMAGFNELDTWTAAAIDEKVHDLFGDNTGRAMAPMRIAVSGVGGGPDMFPMLELLGKDRVVARITACLERYF